MGNASFNQDWYGMQAKVLAQSDDHVVVDYGCKGRGIVKNYNLFEGIQLCFLDFESDAVSYTHLDVYKRQLWYKFPKTKFPEHD